MVPDIVTREAQLDAMLDKAQAAVAMRRMAAIWEQLSMGEGYRAPNDPAHACTKLTVRDKFPLERREEDRASRQFGKELGPRGRKAGEIKRDFGVAIRV